MFSQIIPTQAGFSKCHLQCESLGLACIAFWKRSHGASREKESLTLAVMLMVGWIPAWNKNKGQGLILISVKCSPKPLFLRISSRI